MLALSIRQPYAELILRGIKPAELRSVPTRIIGRRFYIYASKTPADLDWLMAQPVMAQSVIERAVKSGRVKGRGVRGDNIESAVLPTWMMDLVNQLRTWEPDMARLADAIGRLPTGVIVGSAEIQACVRVSKPEQDAMYAWRLANVKRAARLRAVKRQPQPVWFRPF